MSGTDTPRTDAWITADIKSDEPAVSEWAVEEWQDRCRTLERELTEARRVYDEYRSLWEPVDAAVRPWTELGHSVSAKALEMARENAALRDELARLSHLSAEHFREISSLRAEVERLRSDTEFRSVREQLASACAEVERLMTENRALNDGGHCRDDERRLLCVCQQEELARLRGLLRAVEPREFGIICRDVGGANWFDARRAALGEEVKP